jgi:tetratricopeptide (TPR) repeat protein
MKGIFLVLGLLFAMVLELSSQTDTLYASANKFYQDGLYEEAIEKYESIVSGGFESATLYYNLGNASFRSNKLGKARLYYEKALKLNPSDEDAMSNLTYLEGLLSDRFEEVPVIFYKKWFKSLYMSLSSNQWAYISMFSFIFSVLALTVYLLLQRRYLRKAGFYSAIVFFVVSFSAMFASWKQHLNIKNPEAAVVIELSVNAKSAPRETGTGLFVLHEGAKVWLEDKTGGWQEIRLSDGRTGWVPESSITAI